MEITLNGEPFIHDASCTVAGLLELKRITSRRVAVMLNDAVVKKELFAQTLIHEGDRVEIIQMVGGG